MINKVELSIGGGEALEFNFSDANGLDSVAMDVKRSGLVYYEIPFPTILGALVRLDDGDFFDVGANTGIFSLLAAAANSRTKIHAFEPIQYISRLLAENIALNPSIGERITQHQLALSDRDGSFTMFEHVNPTGLVSTSSSLEVEHLHGDVEHKGIDVQVQTLDHWHELNPTSAPTVMKVDVEGHEAAFFKGAQRTLKKFRPFVIVELLSGADFDYFDEFLKEHRYADLALFPGCATLQDRPSFHSEAWNHLFCPQEDLWKLATVCNQVGLPIR